MGRPSLSDRPVETSVNIPETLRARVALYLHDPLRGKMRYGALSKLITNLLEQWVEEQEKKSRAAHMAAASASPSTSEGHQTDE